MVGQDHSLIIMSIEQQASALCTCIDIVSVTDNAQAWTMSSEEVRRAASLFQEMCSAAPEEYFLWKQYFDECLDRLLEKIQTDRIKKIDQGLVLGYFVRLVNLSFLVESDTEYKRRVSDRRGVPGWDVMGGHRLPGREPLLLGRRPLCMTMSGEHVSSWIHLLKSMHQHILQIAFQGATSAIIEDYISQLNHILDTWIPLSDEDKEILF